MAIQGVHVPAGFAAGPPADESTVRQAERALGAALPQDYRDFLLRHDGGEGFIGEHYLVLWKAEELARHNAEYRVRESAPGFLVFGSNGGGEGFAFDTRVTPFKVVEVPFIGMSLADGLVVADGFGQLLERMASTPGSLF